MKPLAGAVLALAIAAALLLAAPAGADLPKPRDTKRITVPDSIAGINLGMKIKRADKAWGRRGDCDFKGFQSCVYEARKERSGMASIEAARRGRVSSFGIYAGRNRKDRYVFKGKLMRYTTKEGIGLGTNRGRIRRAYPKAIRTANKTGYIVEGEGRSYMTFQTLGDGRVTAITVVDGRHQG